MNQVYKKILIRNAIPIRDPVLKTKTENWLVTAQ